MRARGGIVRPSGSVAVSSAAAAARGGDAGAASEVRAVAEREAARVAADRETRRAAARGKEARNRRVVRTEHAAVRVGREAAEREGGVERRLAGAVEGAEGRLRDRYDVVACLAEERVLAARRVLVVERERH